MNDNKMSAIGITVFKKIKHTSLEGNGYREQVIHSHIEDILDMVNFGLSEIVTNCHGLSSRHFVDN